MERDAAGFHYVAPNGSSIAEEIATVTPDEVPVVGAFQTSLQARSAISTTISRWTSF